MSNTLVHDTPDTHPTYLPGQTLVRRSLPSEWRVLLVMARKEWTIFTRYPSWVLAYVIWPVLFPLGMIFTARALSGPDQSSLPAFAALSGTTHYVAYIVIGLTVYTWLNITLWDVGFQLRGEQMRGTLESNWLCPVWRFSIMLGPSLTKLGTSLLFLIMAVLEFRLIFGVNLVGNNVPLVLLILLLTVPSIYGIGVAFGSLVIRVQEAGSLVLLIRGLFMVFAGTSYPIAVLPPWMQAISACLPLTYAIHSLRDVTLNNATFFDVWPDLQMLILLGVVISIAGYLLFRFTERRARRSGSLGRY
jgi:ABC-2 type transport system permease protein